MKIKILYFLVVICIVVCSCNSKVEGNKAVQKIVSLICLKENDTIYVKITNGTDSVIYVPREYYADYTNNNDTLHFGTVNKAKYGDTYYYKYKSIFPFEFYTAKPIKGYKADTIEKYNGASPTYNQFGVQPILPIKPGSSYFVKLIFDAPRYATIIQAVYYHRPFLKSDRSNKFDDAYGDFLKFDDANANYVNTPILIRYH